MAGVAVLHGNMQHIPYTAFLIPDFKLGIYRSKHMRNGQSLSARRLSFNSVRNLKGLSSSMLIVTKASFPADSQAQHLPECWQNMVKIFENEASVEPGFIPISSSLHLHFLVEGIFSAIPIEVSVASVAALVSITLGYIIATLPASRSEKLQNYGSGNCESLSIEWLLVMKSTPFNRFVMMRCPSIMFKDNNVLKSPSKKLSTNGHHVTMLSHLDISKRDKEAIDATGLSDKDDSDKDDEQASSVIQIPLKSSSFLQADALHGEQSTPIYQRTFLHTEDGGVLAVDWPSQLDLTGEHGLDVTVLLVAGSAGGSGDESVQELVKRSIRCGYFPVVLNPRGCGGSLLTTPRLFTAGDSDDVRTAVHFVLKSRPWATLLAVGWGYGANMLVRYLGEEAAAAPVTAAVCIESIFELEELSRLNQEDNDTSFNQKMTKGFVQILKSNQMVFEGKRDFDAQNGLVAKSIRDFDKAISVVSKGYDSVQDFYKDSSSKSWINNVQIPVLFIQGADSVGKTFSIPHHFEENSFTTLILQLSGNGLSPSQTKATRHCDCLVIEWLAAVEMALLKGRHPLVQGLDLTFQPLARGRSGGEQRRSSPHDGNLRVQQTNSLQGFRVDDIPRDDYASMNERGGGLSVGNRDDGFKMNASPNESKALVSTSESIVRGDEDKFKSEGESEGDKDLHENSDDSGDDESEVEQGQVRQAAESIMKVLDVTMPGTLSEKQKEEVLQAVGRGESLVTALQEACPEDVREKMTTAVSAAVQAKGMSLKLAGFGKSIPAPKIPNGMVEKIQENLSSIVRNNRGAATHDSAKTLSPDTSTSHSKDASASGDQSSTSNQNEDSKSGVPEGLGDKHPDSDTSKMEPVHKGGSEVEGQDSKQVQTPAKETQNSFSSGGTVTEQKKDDSVQVESKAAEQEKGESIARPARNDSKTKQGDAAHVESHDDSLPKTEQKHDSQDQNQGNFGAAPQTTENPQTEKKLVNANQESHGDPLPKTEQKHDSQDQNQVSSGEAPQMTENPQTEKSSDSLTDSNTNSENPDKKLPDSNVGEISQPPSQAPAASSLPSIDVTRAFEALTGVDDSTQMAVANVFGVIESVLQKLEKEQGQKGVSSNQPTVQEQHSSRETGHDKSVSGSTNQKQSSLHEETSGGNKEQEQIAKTGRDKSERKTDESSLQMSTNREIVETAEKESDRNGPHSKSPPTSTVLNDESTLDMDQELDNGDLALEYFEDENVWKLTDSRKDTRGVSGTWDNGRTEDLEGFSHSENGSLERSTEVAANALIKPECMAVDSKLKHAGLRELISDALELEILRRLGNVDISAQQDIDRLSSAVAEAAELSMRLPNLPDKKISDNTPFPVAYNAKTLHVDTIVSTINEVYGNLTTLPRVLPAGVLFGVILAALSPLDVLNTDDTQGSRELVEFQRGYSSSRPDKSTVESCNTHQFNGFVDSASRTFHQPSERIFRDENTNGFTNNDTNRAEDSGKEVNNGATSEKDSEKEVNNGATSEKEVRRGNEMKPSCGVDPCINKPGEDVPGGKDTSTSNNTMGAVAAAMGVTAAWASENTRSENHANPSEREEQRADSHPNVAAKFGNESHTDDASKDDSKSSIVSTLAERAISVAAPVVPTKDDGEVDHERLVEILAGLGQKGGILRFVGKMALLWGGLRGAMSLTDRLLVFVHMSDRPLYQRLLGFMIMAFLLWSPVLVPLLPTLLQQWASGSLNGVGTTAALIGMYGAVVILIAIWGRRIRAYKDPLQEYGVRIEPAFNAKQFLSLMSGLALGLSIVASVYGLGVSTHILRFDWAPALSFDSTKTFLWNLASGWRIFKLLVQCFSVSLAVSFVEELFFRSWLLEEISADFGFHRAAALSGLAFSITHWSLPAIPGLWLQSLVLTGAKVGSKGDLMLAIGIHAGLLSGTQLVSTVGQVRYAANASLWFIGNQTGDPFTGVIGLTILGVLASIFYPWGYTGEDKD